MIPLAVAALVATFVAWAATRSYIRYAVSRGVLDVPNERSSHQIPTPRGGGIVIAAAFLLGIGVLAAAGLVPLRQLVALAGGGAIVAAVGYADDHRPVPPWWRLVIHTAAAAWLVWWLGPGTVPATDSVLGLGLFGDVLALLYVIWLINLTNFMDGIDGLASGEAISVALGGTVLFVASTAPVRESGPVLVLAGACLGFLAWNWPPARIFMGDVGSGFVGFSLAAVTLHAGERSLPVFWGLVILMGVFIVDATWTLLRRLLRGERVYQAHRSHGYQIAAARAGSHRHVTLAVLAINLFWLLPMAVLVTVRWVAPLPAIVIAFMPLVAAALVLGAGGAGVPPTTESAAARPPH